jgi:hypothetical protein
MHPYLNSNNQNIIRQQKREISNALDSLFRNAHPQEHNSKHLVVLLVGPSRDNSEAALRGLDTTLGLASGRGLLARADTHGGSANATLGDRTRANKTSVDSARDAVLSLDVELGEDVSAGGVDGSRSEITLSSSLNHVADEETLDSLILGDATSAVGAADGDNVATALTVLTTITTFLGHLESIEMVGEKDVSHSRS